MLKKVAAFTFCSLASLLSTFAESVATVPVGYISFNITGGTVSAPGRTAIAVPLIDTPQASGPSAGKTTSVSANSISMASATWTTNALAAAEFPYAVRILSGNAEGRLFDVLSNTATSITFTTSDVVSAGVVVGDRFELAPLDTLKTFLGATAADLQLKSGPTAATADNVLILSGGTYLGYFFSTGVTPNRWLRTTGPTTDRGNTVLRPDRGILIERRDVAFTLTVTGRVPTAKFRTAVGNNTTTLTHSGFPTDVTLGLLAIQDRITGWRKNVSPDQADKLAVLSGGTWVTYYHNTSSWVRTTGPAVSRDGIVVGAGAPLLLTRQNAVIATNEFLRSVPYSL